ncbi:MAG TPA: hypothetical protein VJ875_18320 [Pyrinomonadaceae bacterium]|nr:hypothetical protein [Pyrinomonadaceae bacterium]
MRGTLRRYNKKVYASFANKEVREDQRRLASFDEVAGKVLKKLLLRLNGKRRTQVDFDSSFHILCHDSWP